MQYSHFLDSIVGKYVGYSQVFNTVNMPEYIHDVHVNLFRGFLEELRAYDMHLFTSIVLPDIARFLTKVAVTMKPMMLSLLSQMGFI